MYVPPEADRVTPKHRGKGKALKLRGHLIKKGTKSGLKHVQSVQSPGGDLVRESHTKDDPLSASQTPRTDRGPTEDGLPASKEDSSTGAGTEQLPLDQVSLLLAVINRP